MNQLRVDRIEAWKAWLRQNHGSEEVVWLVFRKKGNGVSKVPFSYQETLDEALCMGWVDSLLKRIDESIRLLELGKELGLK